jgi:HlyD family secretion protein
MDQELKSLRIDRSRRTSKSSWASKWIVGGVLLFALLGAARLVYGYLNKPIEVSTQVVPQPAAVVDGSGSMSVLDATGYIVAAHKIEVASKVIGRVAWIGVDKGDRVREGQIIVRLEDDEYRAQVNTQLGQLESLKARLAEAQNGSRPEEIARAEADFLQAKADLQNANVSLERTKKLVSEGVLARQALDDAVARADSFENRVKSLQRSLDLFRIGPRKEVIAAFQGQVREAQGRLEYAQTQLANTVIKSPVAGTILDRNVEKGEFVTTGFAGEGGAKGFVVTLADLNDLEVELDINQNDFAKLRMGQKAVVFTDAYPDRKYQGIIDEISPEANRQKATVQVKVKVQRPDEYLRPDMNATVQFQEERKADTAVVDSSLPVVVIPANAIKDNMVWLAVNNVAQRRAVRVKGTVAGGTKVEGLSGGESLILDAPVELKVGAPVKAK